MKTHSNRLEKSNKTYITETGKLSKVKLVKVDQPDPLEEEKATVYVKKEPQAIFQGCLVIIVSIGKNQGTAMISKFGKHTPEEVNITDLQII